MAKMANGKQQGTRTEAKLEKKIVADFIETNNKSETARRNGVSITTVRRVLNREPKLVERVKAKKEEEIQDVFKFMESKKKTVCDIIERCLMALDENKIKSTNAVGIATAMAIVIDKFSVIGEIDQTKRVEVEFVGGAESLFETPDMAAGGADKDE